METADSSHVQTVFQLLTLYFHVSAPSPHPFYIFSDNSPHTVTAVFLVFCPPVLVLSRAPALDPLSIEPKALYYLLFFHAIIVNSFEIQSPNR